MSSIFSDTSFVSATSGCAATDDNANANNLVTPLVEETYPLIPKNPLQGSKQRTGRDLESNPSVPGAGRALRKSSSDHSLAARLRQRGSTTDSVQTTFRVGDLQPRHRPLRRSSSNSSPRRRSRYHDPAINSATLQEQLIEYTKRNGQSGLQPWRVRRARTTNSPVHGTNPTLPRPGFKWFLVRSKSDTGSTPQVSAKTRKKNIPLKSSLKRKSKSAAATPPSGTTTDASTPVECQQLRRVKTVEFEETISKKLLPLPPLQPWSTEPGEDSAYGEFQTSVRTESDKACMKPQLAKSTHACPVSTIKSKAADCAVTRTDVHVVAIAPSLTSDVVDGAGIDLATPTMQIVESKNGCYEVIWDDIPAEDDIRQRRRSSSASQALHTVGSTAARGLERVNSKLTEWTWKRKGQQEPFKPQIVVFPDDEGCSVSAGKAVRDDQEAMIMAPPNSQRTSAIPSRLPSQAVSACASRSGSHDEGKRESALEESDTSDERVGAEDKVAMLVVPDPEASATIFTGVGQSRKEQPAIRRLSNMEESELKFRGHRDSVTLARSRILHARGTSPELFMHSDSVAVAKKRMHARNHAISDAREISRPKVTAPESVSSLDDLSLSPSLSSLKEHANKALKSNSSASMLHPQASPTNRHIRIVE